MLGTDLMQACKNAGVDAVGHDLPELNMVHYKNVWANMPDCDWVVNCAAFTNVDGAEKRRFEAFAVNAVGVRHVARICVKRRIRLLHISTDYVFDGMRSRAYRESDQPNPLNIYGASKLAGEKAIRAEGGHYLILRSQSLYGVHGHNFVKAIINKLTQEDTGEPLRVVEDQVTSPTYTVHLAEAIVKLLPLGKHGMVHVSGMGQCSWYGFAKAIAQRVKPDALLEPVPSTDLDRAAERPEYAVLDNRRYRVWTGEDMPTWQEGLDQYLTEEGY